MILFRPGQQIKTFAVYRKQTAVDERGRVTYGGESLWIGEIQGSLSTISQTEKNRWRQMEHPASHRIVVRGRTVVQPEDILCREGSIYHVQSVEEPAEVGIFQILYCEKRKCYINMKMI